MLLSGSGGAPPDAVEQSSVAGQVAFTEVLVSLGSAFIDLAVQGLSYYLLAFLVPVFVALVLAVKQRRERLDLLEV